MYFLNPGHRKDKSYVVWGLSKYTWIQQLQAIGRSWSCPRSWLPVDVSETMAYDSAGLGLDMSPGNDSSHIAQTSEALKNKI